MRIITRPFSIDLVALLVIPLSALLIGTAPRSSTTSSRFGPLQPHEVRISEIARTGMRVDRYLGDLLPLDPYRLA